MKTRLLRYWRMFCRILKVRYKFLTSASAYRSAYGDWFFSKFIKHHHLYESIKLECDILGVNTRSIWKKTHPLHSKYAPSKRLLEIESSSYSRLLKNIVGNLDMASLYPFSLTAGTQIKTQIVDMIIDLR